MGLGEIAIVTGSESLFPVDRVPYGCGKVSVGIEHQKLTGPVADVARNLYFTRRAAEDLMHNPKCTEKIKRFATDVANYAHDLEFFTRQLGLGLKMPTGVEPPYLPLDFASLPDPAIVSLLLDRPALPPFHKASLRAMSSFL
eukprot:TRINITY_DN69535_c0_g1_i1.p1 TRINITY_DN69535_c0_g1~~TRINITY_DN69535_c0_g1_i1.p1  ORF type:complete len:142 (+),score=12.70 TRINITY_DN69535_c0_g1_i1:31-456(+)